MTSKLLQKFLKWSQLALTWIHNLCEFHRQFLPLSKPRYSYKKHSTTGGNAGAAAIKIADLPERVQYTVFPNPWGMLAPSTFSWGKEEATRACQPRKCC